MTSMITLARRPDQGPFGEEELAVLRVLFPHLQRAVGLHQRISSLQMTADAAASLLDRWSLGVILLDSAGRVILMNAFAERIVARKDGLQLDRGVLRALHRQENAALRALIAGAIRGRELLSTRRLPPASWS